VGVLVGGVKAIAESSRASYESTRDERARENEGKEEEREKRQFPWSLADFKRQMRRRHLRVLSTGSLCGHQRTRKRRNRPVDRKVQFAKRGIAMLLETMQATLHS
jgi:hypothetical protein